MNFGIASSRRLWYAPHAYEFAFCCYREWHLQRHNWLEAGFSKNICLSRICESTDGSSWGIRLRSYPFWPAISTLWRWEDFASGWTLKYGELFAKAGYDMTRIIIIVAKCHRGNFIPKLRSSVRLWWRTSRRMSSARLYFSTTQRWSSLTCRSLRTLFTMLFGQVNKFLVSFS